MTVGDLGVAIRRMLRLPGFAARRPHWAVLGVVELVLVVTYAIWGSEWWRYGLVVGSGTAVVAVFLLLGRLWGWIVLAAGLGLGLGLVPLFGVLGLELATAVAVFASLMGADLGSAVARQLARMPPSGVARAAYPGRALATGALASAGLAVAIALVPGVIAAVRGLFVPTCDWEFGIVSYVAMPLASAALAGAIGHSMGALVGPVRFVGAWVAQLPAIVVAVLALWRFHAAPPVYTYNAILGYFPGNLYDENVRLTATLAWSRLEQLAWVVAVLALVAWRFDVASYRARLVAPRPATPRLVAVAVALVALAAAVGLRMNGGRLGFAVDAEDLEAALGGRFETEHFIIHYSRTPEIESSIAVIAADHEFRYAQVVAQLGVAPRRKLVSFYFASPDEKYRLHGSRHVEMAKPWRGEIYLDHRPFPHRSLRHEIAHAVAAEFGDWMWGVSAQRVAGLPLLVNPGMVEGLAVAIDWPGDYDRPHPHESVRILQRLGKDPSIDRLFGLSFFSVSAQQGYTTAGSFVRFLLDRYGAARLRVLYQTGGDFEAAYAVSRDELEREWKAMLATIAIPDDIVESQKERFRGGSVFSKPCPHAIAKTRDRAFAALGAGDRPRAIALMRDVCRDSQGEPRYRLDLGDLLYGGEHDRGEAHLHWTQVGLDERGVTTSLRANALDRLARAAVQRGELAHAGRLLAYARSLALGQDQKRQLDAAAIALAHEGPAGPALRSYMFAREERSTTTIEDAAAAVAAEPNLGLARYLLGLQHHHRGNHAEAARQLQLALARGLPGPAFVRNAARMLATAAYRARDINAVAVAIAVLWGPGMTSGDHLLAKDWQDRLRYR
jgi:hypothetical protein